MAQTDDEPASEPRSTEEARPFANVFAFDVNAFIVGICNGSALRSSDPAGHGRSSTRTCINGLGGADPQEMDWLK